MWQFPDLESRSIEIIYLNMNTNLVLQSKKLVLRYKKLVLRYKKLVLRSKYIRCSEVLPESALSTSRSRELLVLAFLFHISSQDIQNLEPFRLSILNILALDKWNKNARISNSRELEVLLTGTLDYPAVGGL